MPRTTTYVIIGGGLAGAKAAEGLRAHGYEGQILIVGAEAAVPYERPGLSKGLLHGTSTADDLLVHPESWYAENAVELLTGAVVADLDRVGQALVTADGTRIHYDKALLATGSAPRHLTVPGGDQAHYLRTLDDATALSRLLVPGSTLVVVGGGWIGLETAAAARRRGVDVTVLEPQLSPLHAVLGLEIGGWFAELHRQHGVHLRLSTAVTSVAPHHVVTSDGERLSADVVLAGVGARPRTRLAEEAGLDVDNGVVVDAFLRTPDPRVLAAGDVARAYHPGLRRHIRVEHWANALNQGLAAGAALAGAGTPYERVPYFYTDQYETGMEYAGFVAPGEHDRLVVRGDAESGRFLAFWLSESRVLAGMNVSTWDVQPQIQSLVRAGWRGERVDPGRLADPDVPLEQVLVSPRSVLGAARP
jgi:3-phenylpropionate/trans-cinnamate dioxygenase ferredoxin reductase subunit